VKHQLTQMDWQRDARLERNSAWLHLCERCAFTGIDNFRRGFLRFADDIHAPPDGTVDFANNSFAVRHQTQRPPLITTRVQRCDVTGLRLHHRARLPNSFLDREKVEIELSG